MGGEFSSYLILFLLRDFLQRETSPVRTYRAIVEMTVLIFFPDIQFGYNFMFF